MRLCSITSELEGHWKLESWMLMKVARPVWGGAVGNVPQGNALAAYSTGGRMEQGQKWHLASRLPYNILRKAFPNSFGDRGQGIGGPAVAPGRLAV